MQDADIYQNRVFSAFMCASHLLRSRLPDVFNLRKKAHTISISSHTCEEEERKEKQIYAFMWKFQLTNITIRIKPDF